MEIKGHRLRLPHPPFGLGNFREIDVEDLTKHKMDSEQLIVTPELVELVNHAKDGGHKVCAVGTSVMRGIESAVSTGGHMKTYDGWTNKFISPALRLYGSHQSGDQLPHAAFDHADDGSGNSADMKLSSRPTMLPSRRGIVSVPMATPCSFCNW